MKENKKQWIKPLMLISILLILIPPVLADSFRENNIMNDNPSEQMTNYSPGEIIDITFSNNYPAIGEPVIIQITFQGNPRGRRFTETLTVIDEFEGIIIQSFTADHHQGIVEIFEKEIRIGRLPQYITVMRWYPVIAGNHSLQFRMGSFPTQIKNISVSYSVDTIIFPSIGCPSIIIREHTDTLTLVVSEKRKINDNPLEINTCILSPINDSSSYILDNQNIEYQTWIAVNEHSVADIAILSYNISTVPYGFYGITITTKKDTYTWSHAVQIRESEPDSFRFVQLSDIHIGKVYSMINEKQKLIEIFTYINNEIQPDFVVLSGDVIDWYNKNRIRNVYNNAQEAIQYSNSPVFIVPGNHERYERRLLFFYYPYFDISYYHRYLNPINDYAWEYAGVNFIFLDSGYDYSRWEIKPDFWNQTPEGSGLTNTQMYLLTDIFGSNSLNQIIIMHHPSVNDRNDSGLFSVPNTLPSGNDECIVFNRAEFIEYCINTNVMLVLSGHTHQNKILDYKGKPPSNCFDWPVFVQTDSAILNRNFLGGRVIHIDQGIVTNYDFVALSSDFLALT
ncbi:MAG: metallophosphoesterase [Thermoplasmatota archaeon]